MSTARNIKLVDMANMEHNKVTGSGVQLKSMFILKPILNNQLDHYLLKKPNKMAKKYENEVVYRKCHLLVDDNRGRYSPSSACDLGWSVCTTHQPAHTYLVG